MVKLIWSPKSLNDIKSIYDYISIDSEENASFFVHSIIEVTNTLAYFPLQGRVVPELSDNKFREKLFNNYRIIYRLDSSIEIVTIIHTARQFSNELSNFHKK